MAIQKHSLSGAEAGPLERGKYVQSILRKTAQALADIEKRTGWRILIQWGEPLWEIDSPDLHDFEMILALFDVDNRVGETWMFRTASCVDSDALHIVRVQCRLLARDLTQTSPEFALERFIERLERTLSSKPDPAATGVSSFD